MKITIIILAILLYISCAEWSFQWIKSSLSIDKYKKTRLVIYLSWPICWIIGASAGVAKWFEK